MVLKFWRWTAAGKGPGAKPRSCDPPPKASTQLPPGSDSSFVQWGAWSLISVVPHSSKNVSDSKALCLCLAVFWLPSTFLHAQVYCLWVVDTSPQWCVKWAKRLKSPEVQFLTFHHLLLWGQLGPRISCFQLGAQSLALAQNPNTCEESTPQPLQP